MGRYELLDPACCPARPWRRALVEDRQHLGPAARVVGTDHTDQVGVLDVCLTRSAVDCADDEPARFAPSGQRSYARVVPNDADQAAGLVSFAKGEGFKRPVVLFAADDPTSLGQAVAFRNAARRADIPPVAMHSWDPEADGYSELMETVAGDHPDVVILAGLTEQNGGAVIQAKVEALGPNDGDVALLAPDGFAQQSTIDEAGDARAAGGRAGRRCRAA